MTQPVRGGPTTASCRSGGTLMCNATVPTGTVSYNGLSGPD